MEEDAAVLSVIVVKKVAGLAEEAAGDADVETVRHHAGGLLDRLEHAVDRLFGIVGPDAEFEDLGQIQIVLYLR
jgi:hypothetical protein